MQLCANKLLSNNYTKNVHIKWKQFPHLYALYETSRKTIKIYQSFIYWTWLFTTLVGSIFSTTNMCQMDLVTFARSNSWPSIDVLKALQELSKLNALYMNKFFILKKGF